MGSVENNGDTEDGLVIRARGLPWACTEDDVKRFFNDPNGDHITGVHFTFNREGRPSGEAYVEFNNDQAIKKALLKDHDTIGHRYIEVFRCKKSEMAHVIEVRGSPSVASAARNDEGVVRLRGLPFGATKEDVVAFFPGLAIVPNGVAMPTEQMERASGEAFVQFADLDSAEKALEKHMSSMGHRYIEVFRSSFGELEAVQRRMAGNDSFLGYGGGSRMGGPPMMGGVMGGGRGQYSAWGGGGWRASPYDRPTWGYGGGGGYGRGGTTAGGGYGGAGSGAGGMGSYGGWGGMGSGGGWSSYGYGSGWGRQGGGWGSMGSGNSWGSGSGWGSMAGYGRGGGPIRSTGFGSSKPRGAASTGMKIEPQIGSSTGSGAVYYAVRMRGLPFQTTEKEVNEFFSPLIPAQIEFLKEFRTERPSGECKVSFNSQSEASEAMKKDRQHLGSRYVELFNIGTTPAPANGFKTDYTNDLNMW